MSFSAIIGNLRANLGLDTAQFDQGADRAQARLARMQQSFARFAAGAVAAGGALGALGVKTINSAREISQLSQVANAAPEQFQRWAAASATVGIEQDKLADILKDVNDRVGDFLQTGGGPMADFFENIAPRVGVTAEQFAKLSGPEALQLYVDSLEKAGVSQSEMTFYLEAMSSDLTKLQPLLRDGGSEIQRLGERAAGFGAVMDEKTLASLKRAKRSLVDVQTVFRGFGNMLGAAVAPMIEQTANTFVRLSQKGAPLNDMMRAVAEHIGIVVRGVITLGTVITGQLVAAFVAARFAALGLRGALIRTGIGALVVLAGELVYQFGRLVDAAGGVGAAFGLVLKAGHQAFSNLDTLGQALTDGLEAAALYVAAGFLDAFDRIRSGFANLVDFMLSSPILEAMGIDIGKMAGDWLKGSDFGKAADSLRRMANDQYSKSIIGFENAIPSIQEFRDLFSEAMGETAHEADDAASATDRLNRALGGINGVGGGKDGGAKGASEKLSEFARVVKSTKEEVQKLNFEAASLLSAEASANGVADAMTYARKRAELLNAAQKSGLQVTPQLRERVNELARAYSQAGYDAKGAADRLQAMEDQANRGAEAIGNMFTGMLDGSKSLKESLKGLLMQIAQFQMMQGIKGLFGSGGAGSGFGSWLGGLIGQNANGTGNWKGGWTMVGERGRELVNLPKGSQVVRNAQTEQMMGGGRSQQHNSFSINVQGAGTQEIMRGVQAAISQSMQEADRQLPDKIQRFNRDPSYRPS